MAFTLSPDYDVFFSYSRSDQAAVAGLKEALVGQGVTAFLDQDDLVAGMPWPQALEQGLRATRSVLVVIGRDGFGPWQKREMWFALDRQANAEQGGTPFPVIPVLLPGADPTPGFLFSNTWVDLRGGGLTADRVDALVRAIRFADPTVPAAGSATVCPFRGLRAFREEDAGFYFGREVFAAKLLQRIHSDTSSSNTKLVAVVGPSGSGKSSLVLAGLLPLLRRQRPPKLVWDAITFTPRERPWRALAEALVPLLSPELSAARRIQDAGTLARDLERGEGALESAVRAILEKQEGTDRLLLIVDQFEELFTLSDVDRATFVNVLLETTRTAPVTVLLTLRADFYGLAVACHRALSDALETGQVNLGPLERSELARVVEQPAARVGLRLESGLPERIIDDVEAQPGSLPLLEYALAALWTARSAGHLTHAAYLEMGGISGAIVTTAEEVFAGLAPELQEAARRIFPRLVRTAAAGDDGADTRRRARLSDIGADDWPVVERFAAPAVRLLVISRDDESGGQTVELAHEAIVRAWARLRAWIDDDRAFLLWRQWLAHALSEWVRARETDDLLLRGERLREAVEWMSERRRDLNESERRFILAATTDEFHVRQIVTAGLALVPFANGLSGPRWILALLGAVPRDQVLTAAGAIRDPDAAVGALCVAADACWQSGLRNDAFEMATHALDAAGRIRYDHVKEQFVVQLLPILVAARRVEATLAVLRAFELPEQRAGLLVRLADLLKHAGCLEEAEAARREAFGIAERTLAAAALTNDEGGRYRAVLCFAKGGFVEQAQSAAQSQPKHWPAVLEEAVQVLAREGRVDEALAAVSSVDPQEQSKLLGVLATGLAAQRNPRTVDAIRRTPRGSETFAIWQAAGELARAGLFAEARESADLVSEKDRIVIDREIVEAFARAGRPAEAVEHSARIRGTDDRAWALGRVAHGLVESGHLDEAIGVVPLALASADESGVSHSTRYHVMGDVAHVFARVDRGGEAVAAADRIASLDHRARVLADVADTLARRGHPEEARSAALASITCATDYGRAELRYTGPLRSAAALALARAGFVEDALATAGALVTSSEQGLLVIRIGLVRVAAGDTSGGQMILDRALSLVDTPSDDTTVAARVVPAAAVLAAALGKYDFARQLVERCPPEGRLESYATVLRVCARRQHPQLENLGAAQWRVTNRPGELDYSELGG